MKKFILFAGLIFPFYAFTQEQIKGKVFGKDSTSLSGVAITVFENASNNKINSIITDDRGEFNLKLASKSVYLTLNHLGYIPYVVKTISENDLLIYLKEQTQTLKEITVNTQKPLLEQQFDRTVVNVNGNVRLGINAVDILKKVPGIMVKNGTEILLENNSVSVMMDGKLIRVSGNDLINLLSATSPAAISQIEVIHSPSAKADAQGGGAIINIKSLVRQTPGYDMNVGLTTGHGWKFPSNQSLSLGLTYRLKDNYIYGSYGYSFGKQSQEIENNSFFRAANQRLAEKQIYTTPYGGHNLRVGWDHYFRNKAIFGVLVTAYQNNRELNLNTQTNIFKIDASVVDSMRYSASVNETNSRGVNLNLNFKTVIDTVKKAELTMDADLGEFNFKNNNFLNTQLQDVSGKPLLFDQKYLQDGQTLSTIYSYKTDYTQNLYKGKLEAGLKASYVNLNNDFNAQKQYNGGTIDAGSNIFLYKETLLAAYVSTRQTFKKFTLQLGLRAEETLTNGNSITLNNVVKRNYLNLFPNVTMGYKLGKDNLSLSYARRIGRPSYSALNPFVIVKGAYDSYRGNPFLNPSFNTSYRLGYTSASGFAAALSYSWVNDVITDLREVNNQTKVSTSFKTNMNRNYNTGLNLSYYKQFFKIWDLNISGGSSLNRYQFNIQNEHVKVEQLTAYTSINSTLKFKKDWWFDVYMWAQSRATYGSQINLPYYFISPTIGKAFLKNKATLSLAVNDIFFTSITRSEANYANVNYNLRSQYDSRDFRLRFNYRFGNSKIEIRRRNAGSAEEQGRNQ